MMRKKKRSSSVSVDEDPATRVVPKSKKSKSAGRPAKSLSASVPDSVFGHMLQESGVILRQGNMANEIAVDQVVFQKRLQQHLRKSPRYPNIIQEFISGLESHFEDPERFRNCLLPCVPRSAGEGDTSSSSFQESLVRMLLGVEILQTLVINTLFEKLPEFMFEGVGEDGLNIPHLIINQLKWLDRLVDCKDLGSKLMQLVSVAPVEIQRDIITSLPEILEDSQHGDMARELNALLQQNTQLTVPILDALSSLNLSSTLLSEVRGAVMVTVAAVQLEDLPVVVKFILHSISASDANEVVCILRKKLELEQCVLSSVLQASQSRDKSKKNRGSSSVPACSSKDSVALVLEVIKSAVRFQKTISEAWLKAIENVTEQEDHKVVDVLVLLILHSTNANQSRRGAERVLKAKVRGGLIHEALLNKTFRDYAQVMRGYFPSILSLAQGLLRSTDCCVVPFGGHIYKQAFTAFDSYCQQEVVGSLVTHVCSGVSGEVDVALELLCELVSQKPTEMAQYAVFVKGILDYMDNLSPQQIRRLFHVLSCLAFGQDQHGSHIQDDMHIVIRKQLSSTVPKYKRIGIIGAVMMVGSMAARRDRSEGSQGGTLPKDTHRQVTVLLELVRSCSEGSAEAAALYYDELANLLHNHRLDPLVQAWIGKSVLEDFQEDFVVDLGPEIPGSFPFTASVMYNLDEDESQGGIAINLLPLMAKDLLHKADSHRDGRHVSPLCLSSFFRLLRLCEEEQHQGDLEEVDALLGCPLILTDMEVVEKVESLSKTEREFLCSLLFYTINWFREVVNAFCKLKDPEMKMKVVTRLQNITYLQTLLETCLAVSPGFTPPLANFDCDSAEVLAPAPSVAPAKKAKKESTGKKRKKASASKNSTDGSQLEEVVEVDEPRAQDHPEKEVKAGVSLSSYWPYFRELDMEALNVLQCGLLSRSVLDTELHSKVREEVQLGPAELVFLLEDMWRKLDFSLAAAPAKKAPFLKVKADRAVGFSHLQQRSSKDVASCCVELLGTLCTHLENCHNHFQTFLNENQGVVDALGVDMNVQQLMCSAYQLLLQVLHTAFSWSGFSQPEQRPLLKSALSVLASRLKEKDADLTLEQLIKHSFEYLLNFRSTVPSLNTALILTQLLIVLSQYGRSSHSFYREHTASLAKHFLCQEWVTGSGGKERGNKHNDALQSLLSIYLGHADDVLKAVEEITENGISELLNAAKDASSRSWRTLNRQTFLVYYKVMMAELEKCVRKIPPGKQTDSREVQSEKLLVWNLAVRDFHILINMVKVFDSRPVLNVSLKYGRLFLECFLKLGMPLLDYSFKKHKEDVQSLLKTFQLSTRQLHHMCGHSKIRQDTALTNHVPALKKHLEQFVYRVKAMLTLNQCQEAFWLGNLKNRDLRGEEILSQRSQESDDEDEESSQLQEGNEESDAEVKENGHQDDEEEEEEDSDVSD
ncbi:Fanconi anemia group D2 protein [Ictalurus punctatus]|uniref:Fanconi anemia group D2 protein n=1 Tax=Ictalurus punctatus TaxID=7998 RepID=A0A2D0RXZ0_ICTPU|nr:Fanconi anemia group D2 protein [Ictalurus punctatus]